MSLSVLMPAYNTGIYIGTSISSIISQSLQDFELLVIDDGSEDDTENIVRRFTDDKRIKYFKKEHTGISDTLNYGLKKSGFDIVARLDSDDIAMPYRLEKQLEVLKNYKADIVSGAYAVFRNKRIEYLIQNPVDDTDIKNLLKIHCCIAHSGVTYRKSVIMKAGGYSQTPLEDYDLWLRLINAAVFNNLREVVTLVRYRDGSESYRETSKNNLEHIKLQNKYVYKTTNDKKEDIQKSYILADVLREYYYGNKKIARKKAGDCISAGIITFKLAVLFFISYLPFHILEKIIESKTAPKIKYFIGFLRRNSRESRYELGRSIRRFS